MAFGLKLSIILIYLAVEIVSWNNTRDEDEWPSTKLSSDILITKLNLKIRIRRIFISDC